MLNSKSYYSWNQDQFLLWDVILTLKIAIVLSFASDFLSSSGSTNNKRKREAWLVFVFLLRPSWSNRRLSYISYKGTRSWTQIWFLIFIVLYIFELWNFWISFQLFMQRFFRYHNALHEKAKKQAMVNSCSSGKGKKPSTLPRIWHVFKKTFPQLFNVFMVFFVTLAVFPAVLAGKKWCI